MLQAQFSCISTHYRLSFAEIYISKKSKKPKKRADGAGTGKSALVNAICLGLAGPTSVSYSHSQISFAGLASPHQGRISNIDSIFI